MKIFLRKRITQLTICLLIFITLWGCDSSANKQNIRSKPKINSESKSKQKKIKVTASKITNTEKKSSGLSQFETNDLDMQSVKQKVGNFEDRLAFMKKTENGMPDEDEIIKLLESVNDFNWLLKEISNLIHGYGRNGKMKDFERIVFLCTNAVNYTTNSEIANQFLYKAANVAKRNFESAQVAIELYEKIIERFDKGLATAKVGSSAYEVAYLFRNLNKNESAEIMFNKLADFENINHNEKGVIYAKAAIASMIMGTEPERSEQIANKLFNDYEIAKKDKPLLRILKYHELRKKYPDETSRQIHQRVYKEIPKKSKKNQ